MSAPTVEEEMDTLLDPIPDLEDQVEDINYRPIIGQYAHVKEYIQHTEWRCQNAKIVKSKQL